MSTNQVLKISAEQLARKLNVHGFKNTIIVIVRQQLKKELTFNAYQIHQQWHCSVRIDDEKIAGFGPTRKKKIAEIGAAENAIKYFLPETYKELWGEQ